MKNLRRTLKVISLVFFIISFTLPLGYFSYKYLYNHDMLALCIITLVFFVYIPFILPVYSIFFYISLLFSSEKEQKKIRARFLIFLTILAPLYLYHDDPNGISGLGLIFWIAAMILMAKTGKLTGEEEINQKTFFKMITKASLFTLFLFAWAGLLYQHANSQEKRKYHFGLIYSPDRLSGFPYLPEKETPQLPPNSIVAVEGDFLNNYLPYQFISRDQFVRLYYQNGWYFIKTPNTDLKADYLYRAEKIGNNKREISLIDLKNNKPIYQQKVRINKRWISPEYEPQISYNTTKLFSLLEKRKVFNAETFKPLLLSQCSKNIREKTTDHNRTISWQGIEIDFEYHSKWDKDNKYSFYCDQEYLAAWVIDNIYWNLFLFSAKDKDKITSGKLEITMLNKDSLKEVVQGNTVEIQTVIEDKEKYLKLTTEAQNKKKDYLFKIRSY